MSELGQVLRLDARRIALLLVVPALAALGVVAARATLMPGVSYWDNAVVALAAAVRLLGPLAAMLAAWAAIRLHRLDYLRELAARSPATGPLLDLALLTAATLLAYGLVAVAVVGETAPPLRPDAAHPLALLAGATALVLHVVAGYLAGRLARHPLAIAAVGLASGLWAALRGSGSSWWSVLPPTAIDRVTPYTTLRGEILAYQVCWSAGLAGALVSAYVLAVTRRRMLLLVTAASLSMTALGTVRLVPSGGAAVVAAPVSQVCRHWPLTICVHPAMQEALPKLEEALTPLAARLGETPAAFTRVVQGPEDEPTGLRGGTAFVNLPDLTPGFEARVVRQIQGGLTDRSTCAGEQSAYGSLVDGWLSGEETLHGDAAPPAPATGGLEPAAVAASIEVPTAAGFDDAAERFASWSEARRRTWLSTHFTAYRTCALSRRHFE